MAANCQLKSPSKLFIFIQLFLSQQSTSIETARQMEKLLVKMVLPALVDDWRLELEL